MNSTKKLILFTIGVCLFFTVACKKDKNPKTGVPELTTTEVTNILATTAMGGGNITSNGGETIVASGICWSKTNNTPTISDDTTKSTTASGSFSAMLKNLTPSATYYVRSYATNRIGTGYGNVITFSTGNGAPYATAVSISGDAKVDALLTGIYTYNDPEADAESGTTFQWYSAIDATGTGEAPISGATAKTFRITEVHQGKFIRFGVTPKSATGASQGIEVKSSFFGAIGEATTVTFLYNGTEVTYGIINGPSGKKWLDRNLGASRVALSVDDYQAYGDMFQWGRLADGHQRVTRTNGTDGGATGVTGITTATSNSDVPATDKFISTTTGYYDWRVPMNDGLWQGSNGINNPCPNGWRIATEAEWIAEGITSANDGFLKLKLTYTGTRDVIDGVFKSTANRAYYWTSTIGTGWDEGFSVQISLTPTSRSSFGNNRGNAYACRCIRN